MQESKGGISKQLWVWEDEVRPGDVMGGAREGKRVRSGRQEREKREKESERMEAE